MRPILLTSSTYLILIISVSFIVQIFLPMSKGYINVNQYCKAFDDNFKPLICIIKNGSNANSNSPGNYNPPQSTPPPPPPPDHHPTSYPILQPSPPDMWIDFEDEDEDEECSCEIKCVPRVIHNRFVLNRHRRKRSPPSTSYRCRSCGTECDVSTTRPPMCYCVIPATKAECNCSATCASFRGNPFYYQPHDDEDDDSNCIISVNSLEDWRLNEEKAPYSCECKRSKEVQHTRRPHFICICQRVAADD